MADMTPKASLKRDEPSSLQECNHMPEGLRQVPRDRYVDFRPLILYLDDLECIERVFRDHCKTLAITTDGYEMDSVSCLSALPCPTLDWIIFTCPDPYISLTLRRHEAQLYLGDDAPHTEGVGEKIAQILRPRQLLVDRRFAIMSATLLAFTCGLAAIIMVPQMLRSWTPALPGAILLLLAYYLYRCTLNAKIANHSRLILTRRKDAPSFWARNKEKFAVHAVNTLIALAIGTTAGYIAGRSSAHTSGVPTNAPASQATTMP